MAKRLELLEFFTTNNSSGWKTKEKILREKEPDIYLNIINHAKDLQFSNELKFTEKIWYFINDEIEQILCPVCGTPIKFGRSIKEGYNKYCSIKCANQSTEHKKNVKQTNLKR